MIVKFYHFKRYACAEKKINSNHSITPLKNFFNANGKDFKFRSNSVILKFSYPINYIMSQIVLKVIKNGVQENNLKFAMGKNFALLVDIH